MKNLKHVPIKNLEKKRQQELEDLKAASMLLRKGKGYKRVVDAISKNFASSSGEIKAGTVGAFFYGCFMETSDNGCLTCSPFCAGSMPVPTTPGWKDCDKSVAIYSDGNLDIRSINENSSEMLVYADSDEFQGISQSDVKKLRNMGITNVSVHSSTQSSSNVTRSGTPESLSKKTLTHGASFFGEPSNFSSETESSCEEKKVRTQSSSSASSNNNGGGSSWGIVAAIVLLVIIALVIIFVWRYFFTASAPKATGTVSTMTTSSTFSGPGYVSM
jgi:hypothetical protein